MLSTDQTGKETSRPSATTSPSSFVISTPMRLALRVRPSSLKNTGRWMVSSIGSKNSITTGLRVISRQTWYPLKASSRYLSPCSLQLMITPAHAPLLLSTFQELAAQLQGLMWKESITIISTLRPIQTGSCRTSSSSFRFQAKDRSNCLCSDLWLKKLWLRSTLEITSSENL